MYVSPLVSVEWLFEHIKDSNVLVLDASTQKNASGLVTLYPNIQIKDAIPFDIENVFVNKESNIPNMMPTPKAFEAECKKLGINKESTLVIYDNLGIYTSPRAWWMFKTMGHKNVVVLDGGLPLWKEEGLPCEEKKPFISLEEGNFKAHYKARFVVDSKDVQNNLNSKECEILDARSNRRFLGLDAEPREGMDSGHIPESSNIPYKNVLSNGKMKPIAELKELFSNFNKKSKSVYTCGSGVTACIILLANELVNKQPKALYDGSWAEWGQKGKFPIEK